MTTTFILLLTGSLSGQATSLNVTGLDGGLLLPSVDDLSELRVLSLVENMLSGEIPATVGNLRFLEVLELQGNNFPRRVPTQMSFAFLQSLKLVNLSGNAFSGLILSEIIGYGSVKVVDLSNNQFSGVIPLNGTCDSLKHLKLSRNFLTGEIPSQIGKCRTLRTLLVDGNILEGRIPSAIGQNVELRVLDVFRNSLTRRVPEELANCVKLSVLVLTNLFQDRDDGGFDDGFRGEFNAFVGNIPHQVLLLPSLRVLWAPRANLGGRLPSGWSELCSLRVLNLVHNYVTGVLPESLGMCKNLSFLDLSSNNLGVICLHCTFLFLVWCTLMSAETTE